MAPEPAGSGAFASGAFTSPAAAARAIRALRAAGFAEVRALMPAPYPEVVAALERRRSRLGAVSLGGAALGLLLGAALTVGTTLDWPLVVGGKPVVSVPPFVVISFELTILVGALATVAALGVAAWRGRAAGPPGAAPGRLAGGIAVVVSGGDPRAAAQTLTLSGAADVYHS
jgi:hypothetical protein